MTSLHVAAKNLEGIVWAEHKYDGERMQIHLNLKLPEREQIKIFSKSGRDSTWDRRDLHE
jgi:DNA ligase 4